MKPIETVDKCTTCSTCVAYCPVTKATRAFKGPKLTGPSSERFRLYDETGGGEISEIEALDYCSNCKNCDIACPSGVKISTLNMLARAEYCKRHKPPLRDWVLSHGRMLGRLARRFPGWLVNVGSTNALTRLILDKFGVDARAPMPVFVPRSFTEWMGDHNAMLTASDRSRLTKKAVFFPGCYVNDYDPQTGKDLVFMLEKAGYEVIVPEFECCGLPMVANGFFDDARAAASRNVDTLAALVSSGDVPVLTVCPSCQLMLKQEYAEYFPELGKHESIVPHVQDACEFLIGLIESGELDIDVREDATKLVYHAPCHLRAQGIGKAIAEQFVAMGGRAVIVDINPVTGEETKKAVTKSSSPKTWKSFAAAQSGKARECLTLPTANLPNWRQPCGKPANRAGILCCATKARACTGCARPSIK